MDFMKEKINRYCLKLLKDQNIPFDQSEYSATDIPAETCERADLRQLKCITIDCDDTKDMDDAVSLCYDSGFYHLMVHIADVSSYVPKDSPQDLQAMARGTSLYFPFMTVGMLAKELSDDLCSLNPGQDRKAITISILLDEAGTVLHYDIFKSTIRSAVKGCYSEVNQILKKNASAYLYRKYEGYVNMLKRMHTLACLLRNRRTQIGSIQEESPETKFTIRSGHIHIDFKDRGDAEKIIEEFMIVTNQSVAEYMTKHNLPCIYRIQKKLNEYAEYTVNVSKHSSLCIKSYAHFTSPIRRLADLKVHQILTAHLSGLTVEEIHREYDQHIEKAAISATKRSRHAKELSRCVEKYCIHEYFQNHTDEIYKGVILGTAYNSKPLIEISSLGLVMHAETRRGQMIGDSIHCKIIPSPSSNQYIAREVFL